MSILMPSTYVSNGPSEVGKVWFLPVRRDLRVDGENEVLQPLYYHPEAGLRPNEPNDSADRVRVRILVRDSGRRDELLDHLEDDQLDCTSPNTCIH